jgi:hypothetical protein
VAKPVLQHSPANMATSRTNSVSGSTSYYALRVARGARAGAWWNAVSVRRDAPRASAALLAGRARVELSHDEAQQALAWAASVDGWDGSERKPVMLFPAPDASP